MRTDSFALCPVKNTETVKQISSTQVGWGFVSRLAIRAARNSLKQWLCLNEVIRWMQGTFASRAIGHFGLAGEKSLCGFLSPMGIPSRLRSHRCLPGRDSLEWVDHGPGARVKRAC